MDLKKDTQWTERMKPKRIKYNISSLGNSGFFLPDIQKKNPS